MPTVNIGCSGFSYDHWRGPFYPDGLPKTEWLEYYAARFPTVELNVTFYRMPKKETFMKWYEETPSGFLISLKGSRFITHVKKLKAPAEPLDVFFSRALALKEKLGVILWQLPPGMKVNIERLSEFLEQLKPYNAQHTFEFREESWLTENVISLLRKENVAFCIADWPEFLKDPPLTSNLVYIRRHGEGGSYATCYTLEALKEDAARIQRYIREKRKVFLYFNNDAFGYAPRNALELMRLVRR